MASVDINRCLTMAAFSAFVVLRRYLANHPGASAIEAVTIIRSTNSDAAGLDYAGGSALHGAMPMDTPQQDSRLELRLVISKLIQLVQPWWLRLVPYGREQVRAALDPNQVQCLREAGLFDPVPTVEVVAWWDELSASVRGLVDTERMLQAREAERRSLQHERDRLKQLGLPLEPQWVSLEDNSLGFDIKSFDLSNGQVVARLIEVKSTNGDDIFITRNEWANAATAGPHYCFHVWKLPCNSPLEYPVDAIRPKVPVDQGGGEWQDVRVALDALTHAGGSLLQVPPTSRPAHQ